jgi:hypothetical protein
LWGLSAATEPDDSCGSSGRGATDLLRRSPLATVAADEEEDLAFCGGTAAAEGWGGSEAGMLVEGGVVGVTEAGGGWKGLDLEEETSMPSFSCRQKAQMPLPTAIPAAAAAPGG